MMYYKMRFSNDEAVFGNVFPQTGLITNKKKIINGAKSSFPIINEVLRFSLEKKAKQTEVLSCSLDQFNGWLISKKIADVFAQFDCMDYHNFEAKVTDKKSSYDYFWMHSLPSYKGDRILNYVSYKDSEFYSYDFFDEKVAKVHISSEIEAGSIHKTLIQKEDYEKLRLTKIVFKDNFPELDFFALIKYNFDFFVSERLKIELEKIDNTGLEFVEVKNVVKL